MDLTFTSANSENVKFNEDGSFEAIDPMKPWKMWTGPIKFYPPVSLAPFRSAMRELTNHPPSWND